MGEAAVAITPPADAAPAASTPPAPPAAPESTPAAAPAASPAGTPPPEGGGAPPEGQLPPPGPEPVPYPRFREAQTRASRLERQHRAAQAQWAQEREALARQWQEERAALDGRAQQLSALEQVLEEHPDLADQIYDRVKGGAARPAAGGKLELPPEVMQKLGQLDQVTSILQTAQRQAAERERQAQLADTERQLNGAVEKILTDRGYKSPKQLLPLAANYVLWRVRQMEDADMDDVAPLLAEFLMPLEAEYNARLDGYRQGKATDRQIPAVPGGTSAAPMTSRPAAGANDRTTSQMAEEALLRLGWSNNGG